MPVIIVGNKKDLVDRNDPGQASAVDFRHVQDLSNSNGFMRPLECSAKSGLNVKKIFHALAAELVKRKGYNKPPSVTGTSRKDYCCSSDS